jgi:methyl-accepting chemotaxis protein
MLEAVESSLASLNGVFRAGEEAARTVAEKMSSITSHISTVIASLQFHDIARQRLEHVQSALLSIAQNGEGKEQPVDVCALQAAHLRKARNEMVNAIEKVIEELAFLNADVDQLTAQMKSSAGFQTSDNVSVLGQIDHSLRPVFELLKESAGRTEIYSRVMAKVKEETTAIHRFVDEIEEVVTEIELFALNSRIKSACMGENGAPLSVISEMIGTLSDTSRRCAARILELLTSISRPAQNLAAQQNPGSLQSAPLPADWQNSFAPLLSFLTSVREEVIATLREMDRKTTSLSESISFMIENTSVHTMFAETITKAVQELEDITFIIGDQPNVPTDPAAYEDELAIRYTMESERVIHRHFAASTHNQRGSARGGLSNVALGGSENEHHFDTNVELF